MCLVHNNKSIFVTCTSNTIFVSMQKLTCFFFFNIHTLYPYHLSDENDSTEIKLVSTQPIRAGKQTFGFFTTFTLCCHTPFVRQNNDSNEIKSSLVSAEISNCNCFTELKMPAPWHNWLFYPMKEQCTLYSQGKSGISMSLWGCRLQQLSKNVCGTFSTSPKHHGQPATAVQHSHLFECLLVSL